MRKRMGSSLLRLPELPGAGDRSVLTPATRVLRPAPTDLSAATSNLMDSQPSASLSSFSPDVRPESLISMTDWTDSGRRPRCEARPRGHAHHRAQLDDAEVAV